WDRISSSRPSGDFDVGGQIPRTNDNRVQFVKGLFQDTLPGFLEHFEPTNPLVIHNDSDLYSSTLYLLAKLDPFLEPGSILLFDEFWSSSHEFQAFYDYERSFRRKYRLLASVKTNPYVQLALEIQ